MGAPDEYLWLIQAIFICEIVLNGYGVTSQILTFKYLMIGK